MKNKLKTLIFAAALLTIYVTGVSFLGTHAFSVVEDTAHNVITTDGIDIVIEEWMDTDEGRVQFPQNTPIEFMPNVTVSKIVTVKNNERNAHLRVRCDFEIIDSDGEPIVLDADTLAKTVVLDYDTDNWTLSDGWWYYKKALTKGEITAPLFTGVYFPPEYVGNRYQSAKLTIKVTACATQADNNGSDPLKAGGWPAY